MRVLQGGAVLAALLLSAACGSSGGGGGASSSATPSPTARDLAAYVACLRQHGVNVPTARPRVRPSGGGRIFGGQNNAAARQACQSLAPRLGGRGLQELQAFRSCLADHGVHLPSPSPDPSPGRGGRFGQLNTADPKLAAAMRICRPLLPTRSPRPTPS